MFETRKVLLIGPPGSGKIAHARRMCESLPALEQNDAAIAAWIRHGAGLPDHGSRPVFRAPHHTVSDAGLVGLRGRPGEVSLAHGGCLLLDELPEFRRAAIGELGYVLRQGERPMITRLGDHVRLPARPRLLVAAANVCPCGYEGTSRPCTCSERSRAAYAERLVAYSSMLGIEEIVPLRPVTIESLMSGKVE
jgi:magnesium chelatase family protein